MRKRPASSQVTQAIIAKKPACSAQCWSCIAGGFGRRSSAAQSNVEMHGCCGRCCSSRTCSCGFFLQDKEAEWCRECNQRLARWCKKCNSEDELRSGLCSRCAGLVVPGSDRPKLRKDGVCWSCVAGGFGKSSGDARNGKEFFGCCWACKSHRTCSLCKAFHSIANITWCRQCHILPAVWCKSCNAEDVLRSSLCKVCAVVRQRERLQRSNARCRDCSTKLCSVENKTKGCCPKCAERRLCACGRFWRGVIETCSLCGSGDSLWCVHCCGPDVSQASVCKWCAAFSETARPTLPDISGTHSAQALPKDGVCWECRKTKRALHKEKYKGLCTSCWSRRICQSCKEYTPDRIRPCTLCNNTAVWCLRCYETDAVSRRLCVGCKSQYQCKCGAFPSSHQAVATCKQQGCEVHPLWCLNCYTPALLALGVCADHAAPRICECGQVCDVDPFEMCKYCERNFAMWCSSCNGKLAIDARACSKCFSMRTCPCGRFVPTYIPATFTFGVRILHREWIDRCAVCHHTRAWMCGECHAAGFRRRLCASSTCSSTVDPWSLALCPRSNVARQTLELRKIDRGQS